MTRPRLEFSTAVQRQTLERSGESVSGPMSDFERSEIERLAASLKNPTPAVIARQLGRNVGTVNWYMLTHGLVERPLKYRDTAPYERKGKIVYPYAREHDDRIQELRVEGKNARMIAEMITKEFGIERTTHGIHVRLTMLGAYIESESEAA